MLDIKLIREKPEYVKKALLKKGVDLDIDAMLEFDEKRRKKIQQVDEMRAQQNIASDEIAKAPKEEKAVKIAESKELKIKLGEIEFELKALDEEFLETMRKLPNLPL